MVTTKIYKIILGITVLVILFLPNPAYAASQSEAFYQSGNAYAAQGQYDLAIANFTKAIALNPQDKNYYNGRAAAYRFLDKSYLAIDDYNRVLKMDPNNREAFHGKYEILMGSGVYHYSDSYVNDTSYNPFPR